ncbi:MAG TPA: LAGLIDADG family homing endonuclease [Gemmatimonadaceae bacterium]
MNGMPEGEGRGWAKGRSAKDDPRIARAAASHRGKTYVSRVLPEQDRRRISPTAHPQWTPALAYAIGLIATDGSIARGRTIGFPSADRELVRHLLQCLGKHNKISRVRTRTGGVLYRTQIGDAAFCRWLLVVGITPRKSLTIGPLDVPDDHLFTVARGLLDGDGSIINKRTRADVGRRDDYYWEYLQTKFVCASRPHLEWLKERLNAALCIDGLIIKRAARGGRHDCYTLRYSKVASHRLLPALYRETRAPRLTRKWRVWASYARRHGLQPRDTRP